MKGLACDFEPGDEIAGAKSEHIALLRYSTEH